MNERQQKIRDALADLRGKGVYCPSAQEIAREAKLLPSRAHVLSVTASLRAMERAGVVGRTPPRDRWSAAGWHLLKNANV